ncbi:hypothetical protein SAMN05428989_0001 [Pseudoxanthomonas sp. GM95]|uniref:XAC0095 family protein n=1 Tax=Pseudoxanthomonas sp. GM95 TaxID=1881043 RepID=UPI0008C0A2F9|nr:hypothetical protein [Pseudoxanthomonas sp. GM95]SEK37618.1 hypothetical protein SAMN05428989_0001 [Pseudoxanthomonas sp. GM95]
MAEHTFDDKAMLGYFLPEDGQLLLKQLVAHIRFLARLAQPRIPDESQEWVPVVGPAELMFCLDQLAGQLDLVLGALSWPARQAKVLGEDELEQTRVPGAGFAQSSPSAYACEGSLAFGATVDQIDRLNGLISSIRAHGDVISAGGLGALTAGTLPALGNEIFERADEARRLLSRLEAQPLNDPSADTLSVGERLSEYRVCTVVSTKSRRNHPEQPFPYSSARLKVGLARLNVRQ